jgi:class 3 adenylate cyclase
LNVIDLASRVRTLRKNRCWTQEHLAHAAGINARTVQRVEDGRGVSGDTLLAIASAFDVSPADLGQHWPALSGHGDGDADVMNGSSGPAGNVTIVFTDVQGAMRLWERDAAVMQRSLAEHHRVLRRVLARFGGYEAKTETDSFMIVFSDPVAAIEMCLAAQAELRAGAWPDELRSEPDAATVCDATGTTILRGLRVRMGVHIGEATIERNPLTSRLEYLGPTVNRTGCLAQVGHGGQILVTEDLWLATNGRCSAEAESLGQVRLRGTGTLVDLIQVNAPGDRRTSFPLPRTEHVLHEAAMLSGVAPPGQDDS